MKGMVSLAKRMFPCFSAFLSARDVTQHLECFFPGEVWECLCCTIFSQGHLGFQVHLAVQFGGLHFIN